MSKSASFLLYLLVLGSPGLIIVDHIHFQYNGMMLGEALVWITCNGLLQCLYFFDGAYTFPM